MYNGIPYYKKKTFKNVAQSLPALSRPGNLKKNTQFIVHI